jgi:CRP-like cAMP-binding protein
METDIYEFLVKKVRDYITLSNRESEQVKELFIEEYFKKNEAILKEGDVCKKLYFLAKGLIRFSRIAEGEEKTYVFEAEGGFFCDMESFLQKIPSRNSITTLEPSTVLSITYDNLQVFYNEIQFGDRFGRLTIEQVFLMMASHLIGFYSQTPQQRYVIFANNYGSFLQRIPQYYIASYIGVTPQTLCRIKKKLLGKDL